MLAKTISDGEIDFEKLVEIVAQKSKVPYLDCYRLFMVLEEALNQELKNGKIVILGNIGSFQVGISSIGADSELKVKSNTITNAKVNFRVGKGLRKMLEKLEYKKVKG